MFSIQSFQITVLFAFPLLKRMIRYESFCAETFHEAIAA